MSGRGVFAPPDLDDVPLRVSTSIPNYPDPAAFAEHLSGALDDCRIVVNHSNLGLTLAEARECGVLERWRAAKVPSLDEDIDRCQLMRDVPRAECWMEVDRHVMADVLPWVPLMWPSVVTVTGRSVTRYVFDQFSGMISICHVATRDT